MPRYRNKKGNRRFLLATTLLVKIERYMPFVLMGVSGLLLFVSIISPNVWKTPRLYITDSMKTLVDGVGMPFRAISEVGGSITELTTIRAENSRLKAENDKLHEWYQTAMLLRAENQSLKELLNVIPEPDQSYITARLMSDSGSSFIKSALIAAGTEDGVEEGQAVLGNQGMIGRVVEVGGKASRVLLLTDINSHIPVIIEGANQRAVLAGTNNDLLNLIHLPADVLIETGSRVMTSGTGGMFPSGLPIGEVIDAQNGVFRVKMYSNPFASIFVQIVERPQSKSVQESIKQLKAGDK